MLSERLRYIRKANKKTQDEMAKMLGITRPAYTAYETGRRHPDYETLQKIASIFECSIDYLLGRVNDPQGTAHGQSETDEKFLEFKEMWDTLSEKERHHLYGLAKTYYELKKELKSGRKNES